MRGLRNLHKFSFKTIITMVVFVASCVALLLMCSERASPPSVVQGQRVLYQMMGADNLSQLDFSTRYPDESPSDFVEFLDTEDAEPLWPPTTDHQWEGSDPVRIVDQSTNQLMRPENVDFVAFEVNPELGKQLVYIPDDESGEMRVESYDDPTARPTGVQVWYFPTNGREADLPVD